MRALRPDQVVLLPSGLWVLDALQPVAAVLDPATGALLRLVSWAELPPAAAHDAWPAPRVRSDGERLWTQQQAAGPLVRVGLDGIETAAWTGGLLLAACGPRVAWCAPPPRDQELVAGPDPRPVRQLGGDRLLRVDADGTCRTVRLDHPVRDVRADAEGLLVQVEVEGWTLQHLGADLHEVLRATRWLRLPWVAEVPGALTLDEHGLPADVVPGERTDTGGRGPWWWHQEVPDERDEAEEPSVAALGLVWRFGWTPGPRRAGRRAVASARGPQGELVRRWDLGTGTVRAVTPVGGRMCVVLGREPDALTASPAAGRVLALDPAAAAEGVELLAADGVDVAGHCWPLVPRPVEVDGYLAQVLADHSTLEQYWHREPDADGEVDVRPVADGVHAVQTALVGDWPHTQLEWTFSFAPLPGLVLRRRIPLFDELGRPDPPQYAQIHLMEDLDTRDLPPAGWARDGVLDV